MLYKTLVRTHFDYCDMIYGGISETESNKLQKLQNACIKNILNFPKRTPTAEIHKSSKIELLNNRRWKHLVTEMFKVKHRLHPEYICNMFQATRFVSTRKTRRTTQGAFYPPVVNLEMSKRNFRYMGYMAWEGLPDWIKGCDRLNEFKCLIDQI